MNKSKMLIYLMTIISIILCVPSILYLINNKTVDDFNSYYTYTLEPWKNEEVGMRNGIIVIGLLLIFSIIYIWVIKKEKKIFKNRKQIFIFIMIISFIFLLILPYLSSDIYYYIGDSWLAAEYDKNPYYTSVLDLIRKGINDEILRNTGYWKATTSIYGPLWNMLAEFLVSFSFGNVTIALFIFKFAAYFVHLLNCWLTYKITKSNKYMLLYGLNPLVLLEFLSNVHNDVFLLLFILLAMYFIIRKKNIMLTIISLTLSVSIKYSTILLVPFILIYCFKNKTRLKRILYCVISGLGIILLVVLFYMPYYEDFSIFTNMLVQGEKYNQSILCYLFLNIDRSTFLEIKELQVPTFIIAYVIILFTIIFKKKIILQQLMRKYNFIMLIFIFWILATFQNWYILWLLPTIIWQNRNMRRFIIYLTILATVPNIKYFIVGEDSYIYGNPHSIQVLIISVIAFILAILIKYIVKFIKFRRRKNVKVSFNRWK